MAIWVDADACPNVIKDILFRAAERTQISLTLVANQPLRVHRRALSARCAWRRDLTWRITKSFVYASREIW